MAVEDLFHGLDKVLMIVFITNCSISSTHYICMKQVLFKLKDALVSKLKL